MSIKTYLFLIFVATILALGVFLAILFNVDPSKTDLITCSAFFASLLVFLTGFFTFLGFYLRIYFTNREIIYANLPIAIRQATLVSLLITGVLVFSTLRVLTILSAGAFIAIVILIELFFRTRK